MSKKINYQDLVSSILELLPEREKDVLTKRNALFGAPKFTLEKIGKEYNITRERVRQIENEGIKKIKSIDENSILANLKSIESNINSLIKNYGGFISEDHLIDLLLKEKEVEEELKALNFLLNYALVDKFKQNKTHNNLEVIWHGDYDNESIGQIADSIKELLVKNDKPIVLEDILAGIKETKHLATIESINAENQKIIMSILNAHKELGTNILDEWGMKQWPTITPKRMTDKAYLVMLKEEKPLHFEEVANLINKHKFDHKVACPATVHNELILDDKYVLVGRGIYALKAWGFEKGTVSDIIIKILEDEGPLSKQDIINEVLKQRMVQRTTIILALMNKDKFAKTEDSLYQLV